MRLKYIFPVLFILLTVGVFCITASEHDYVIYTESAEAAPTPVAAAQQKNDRRMVDMIADDSYLIEKGDSTIFILVGNFAAHHNGTVILADSAVRYSNQSFECFGNVLINQNSTYAYADRAAYNRINSSATLFSELIKVVDGEAVMYTYECTFDTANEVGRFNGGCYIEKGESLMESDRGYYYTDTHELIAVDNVEMRDETYQMTGDSVIFNTQTEDARYFTNTNIWNDKDEYLFANEGSYTKARDLHNLTRDAYILSPEREIWSDSLEYCKADGHIVGRSNIQVDDTEQKILGFADYGEWWDEPGNALFTRRPSMINYDPEQSDSLFLAADTMWMYTIAVLPSDTARDTTSVEESKERAGERGNEDRNLKDRDNPDKNPEEGMESAISADSIGNLPDSEPTLDTKGADKAPKADAKSDKSEDKDKGIERERGKNKDANTEQKTELRPEQKPETRDSKNIGAKDENRHPNRELTTKEAATTPKEIAQRPAEGRPEGIKKDASASSDTAAPKQEVVAEVEETTESEPVVESDTTTIDVAADTLAIDTLSANDSIKPLTKRQIRYRAKMEKRRIRDSVLSIERAIRDSIDSIKQREEDSIRHIRDSVLKIKVDSIIAKRIAQSSRIADEEKARIERIKQKGIERERRKIDKAKARAARRGREYRGPDYTIDSLADSAAMDGIADSMRNGEMDSMAQDSVRIDSLGADSLAIDSTLLAPPFPADSTYKMIKAYRNVRMYRPDTQLVSDSLVMLNTDSIIRLYREPILWNDSNQVTADSMAIYTRNEVISKVHFMGDPLMGSEIDTMYYNQVKGKDMIAYFADGNVYRNDVNGNAQTIYYLQDDGNSEVTGLMYIESSGISFYLIDGEMDKITYKQNPEYVIYPMGMVPETQKYRLDDFEWHNDKRPARDSIINREIRPTRREDASVQQKPRFRITERIKYDRRRLTENRMWEDRVDELTPDIIEWRDSRTSNTKR